MAPASLLVGAVGALAGPALAASHAVTLAGIAFNPPTITVAVGDEVVWTHQDGSTPHSVTADDGAFDSSPTCSYVATSGCMTQGATFRHTFGAPGTFGYHCRIHGSMTGTVVVQAASATTPPPTTPPPTAPPSAPPTAPTTTRPATPAPAAPTTTRPAAPAPAAPTTTPAAAVPPTSIPPSGNPGPAAGATTTSGPSRRLAATSASHGGKGGGNGGTIALGAALVGVVLVGGGLAWRRRRPV